MTAVPAEPLLAAVKLDADGLVPVIAQEAATGLVWMFARANRAALACDRSDVRDGDGADVGVGELRRAGGDAGDRRGALLEPIAPGLLAQGRDAGEHAGRARDPRRLRLRH